MAVHVALLRGINIGPSRRVAMGDLRELLVAQGYGDVRTYLQSGNVVLESDTSADELARELEAQLAARFGLDIAVVVRSHAELADVVARDPFGELVSEPKRYQVSFLAGDPPPELGAKLAAAAAGGERVAVSGREIYAWHPETIARSDLATLLASKRLGVGATARNWNTVLALLQLAAL